MKKFLAALLTLALMLTLGAAASFADDGFEPMTISFSMTEADGGVVAQGIDKMKEYISEKTNGAVTIDTYYSSSLMAQDMEIESIMKGTLGMNACWFDWLSPYMDKLEVLNVPYLFANWDHMKAFFASDDAAALCDEIAENTGIRVFTPVYYKGVRSINLNKDVKVTSREDLSGIKLRMPSSEAWQNMGTALGANPVPLGASDLYLALQTGTVDGQDNGFSTTRSFSWDEVTTSITVTGHMISAGFVTINEEVWQSMSDELQQIFREAVEIGCNYISDTIQSQEADDVAYFEGKGIKVYYLSDEELASYRNEVSDYYFAQEDWVKDLDMDFYDLIANMEY